MCAHARAHEHVLRERMKKREYEGEIKKNRKRKVEGYLSAGQDGTKEIPAREAHGYDLARVH